MYIGVPTEIKNHEYRVGLTPDSVRELTAHGHQLLVQSGAGSAIGFSDEHYREAGARLVSREQVFSDSELVVKVKEPQAEERRLLRPGQTLFTYLHLAPDPAQTRDLLASGATCIAYETVTDAQGRLPLLAPMSEVAGRMAIQAGAGCLEKARGGRGVLLGGVPGVPAGRVVILGGGVVGSNALAMAVGLGAQVMVLDKSLDVLRRLDAQYGNRIETRYATATAVEAALLQADLVIGAVLVPGAAAPKLISAELIRAMPAGSVLVDVAIDQGGCAQTSKPTTHAEPTYLVDEVVHYCVANMPGGVARTATQALNNATLPFVQALAEKGVARALREDAHLANGLNVSHGALCNAEVGAALDMPVQTLEEALATLGSAS
ncbi:MULTISPECIES: alanine dehydrogenase [Pseudomonadaceae]|jgi:alanine dehydrogenase|uniref:Alanine dehydrogenase n=2 Tax=Pseudomonas abyssi TaxID=170540 RepID=A0ACD6B3X4_9PSED|nr:MULTISPECIES: alanine dehydrogenase [Pseudomonadaceae]MAC99366.1 alanine dehydrogenase [Pseudomonadales bacterium]PBK05110.1 alanine dehydrogenase [Pseudomonas abyssi]RGP55869.1 alanine dehydrogenase [Halopseudomonas gallaeciensis]|tara:strand:+ start:21927 stop:23057 length:1131 start_codon:yes stop_codon:yes gene_type:complete